MTDKPQSSKAGAGRSNKGRGGGHTKRIGKRNAENAEGGNAEGGEMKNEKIKIQTVPAPRTRTPYIGVKVLILAFEFNDLDLDSEIHELQTSFEALNYHVESYEIPMQSSPIELRSKLLKFLGGKYTEGDTSPTWEEDLKTLSVIYYTGHGGAEVNPKYSKNCTCGQTFHCDECAEITLSLVSHNKPRGMEDMWDDVQRIWNQENADQADDIYLQPLKDFKQRYDTDEAKASWADVQDLVRDAKRDVLLIFDCCEAGLAATSASSWPKKRKVYRKELIGACGWSNVTCNQMSIALRTRLKQNRPSISTATLVREMNNEIVKKIPKSFVRSGKRSFPQTVHYVLQRTMSGRMPLPLSSGRKPVLKAPNLETQYVGVEYETNVDSENESVGSVDSREYTT